MQCPRAFSIGSPNNEIHILLKEKTLSVEVRIQRRLHKQKTIRQRCGMRCHLFLFYFYVFIAVKSVQALEVCVDSVASALNAVSGGARRLELCSSLSLGGLTPSLGLFTIVRKSVPRECVIFVMIRPKPGDTYVYDSQEIQVMEEDIKIFKENGAQGFVFGCLTKDKAVDEPNCLKLLEAAQGLPSTFHRAFDVVENPEDSLARLIKLGFSRILTSGQEENALLGRHLIKKLVVKVKESGSNLVIIPGGGISPENLREILATTGAKEFHGSARGKALSSDDELESDCIYVTDPSVVRDMIKIGEDFGLKYLK